MARVGYVYHEALLRKMLSQLEEMDDVTSKKDHHHQHHVISSESLFLNQRFPFHHLLYFFPLFCKLKQEGDDDP